MNKKLALVEISVFHNVLGGVCRSRGKGKLKKMSIWTSSICDCKGAREEIRQGISLIYIAPATVAAPLVISVEIRVNMDFYY